jgi:amidase
MISLAALQKRAADHIAARDRQIPSEYLIPADEIPLNPSKLYRTSGRLSAREIEIVEHDATGLAQSIAAGTYTSVEVIHAFIKSAVIAHSATQCLAWFDVDAAVKQAKELDEILAKTGRTVGPLHGVPMSVKGKFVKLK